MATFWGSDWFGDTWNGGAEDDSAWGRGGDDTLHGNDGNDYLVGGAGNDKLYGDEGDDQLYGGNNGWWGGDELYGGNGNDYLDGGAGADTMWGGTGDDTFIIDHSSDFVVEFAGEGFDTVYSSVNVHLSVRADLTDPVIEMIILTGTAFSATVSGGGDHILVGNSVGNSIGGGIGNDTLDGGAGSDTVTGGGGNDFVNGGADADYMEGNAGNDTFVVDNTGDWVAEFAGEGIDTIQASITFALVDHSEVENLILTGDAAINGTGNNLANTLTGNGAANALDGGAHNDVLIGGLGLDRMTGGTGRDRFHFANVTESTLAAPDQILDFLSDRFAPGAGDTIDLSAIDANTTAPGNQAFVFIGNNNAFSNNLGVGQLRCNNGFVEGDVNGDLVADFRIQVFQNDNRLVAADFNL